MSTRPLTATRLAICSLLAVTLVTAAERLGTFWLLGVPDVLDVRTFWSLVSLIAMVVLTIGVLGWVAERLGESLVRRFQKTVNRGVTFAAKNSVHLIGSSTVGAWLGWQLSQGAWVQTQWWSSLMPVAGGIGFAALAVGVVAFARYGNREDNGFHRWIVGTTLLVAGLATVVHGIFAMQGTYPEFHLLKFFVAVAITVSGALLVSPAIGKNLLASIAASLLVASAMATSIYGWTSMDDVVRGSLLLRSPIAANVITQLYPDTKTTFLAQTLRDLNPNKPPLVLTDRYAFTDSPQDEKWNVLFIVVDTLRADVLYPLRDPTSKYIKSSDTPFLNEWLKSAVTFRHGYAQSSATHRSMPAMFQSLEVNEKADKVGVPIADEMGATGRTTFAVVNNFFFEPRYVITKRLLENFERVSVYEKKEQENLVPMTLAEMKESGDRPFFGWVHFYNMHEPGFDGVKQDPKKAKLKTRYKRSLRWLDKQMAMIDAGLKTLNIHDRTVVILTADHGEGLGDNNIRNHGSVYEEEIRVPIAIRIPGVKGRVIEETIGNVDLLPTILDLVAEKPNPQHRGRSLLSALEGELPSRTYYMEDYKGKTHAVARDDQKLFYRAKANVFHRYDLAADPTEDHNLFTGDLPEDETLRRELIRINPKLIKSELEDPVTVQLLHQRLRAIDATRPGEPLEFLLRLTATFPTVESDVILREKFADATNDAVRSMIYSALCHQFESFTEMAANHLKGLKDPKELNAFVQAIAERRCPALDPDLVVTLAAEQTSIEDIDAWLELTRPWKKPGDVYLPLWEAWINNQAVREDARTLRALLSNVRTTKWKKATPSTALKTAIRDTVSHPIPLVAKAAIVTAADLGDRELIPLVRAILRDPSADIQKRQASIYAVSVLKPDDAVALITLGGQDNVLVLDAVKGFGRMGDPAGLEYLDGIAKDHYNRIIRSISGRYAKRIRKAVAKKGNAPDR